MRAGDGIPSQRVASLLLRMTEMERWMSWPALALMMVAVISTPGPRSLAPGGTPAGVVGDGRDAAAFAGGGREGDVLVGVDADAG